MTDRFFRLMERHQKIDAALRAEQRRRKPDGFTVQKLKKLKLAIKDQLSSMSLGQRSRHPA